MPVSYTHLPFVFERFYKEDRSRGMNTRGSGLGPVSYTHLAVMDHRHVVAFLDQVQTEQFAEMCIRDRYRPGREGKSYRVSKKAFHLWAAPAGACRSATAEGGS